MSEAAADTREDVVENGAIRVRRALVSVSDKTGVAEFAKSLAALGVELLSTGGTASALREAGLEVTDVAEFTGQEEILGGRVKTLHPRLHAALLARRSDPEHMAILEREGIAPIDLVCVNLYPFEQTVAAHEVDPQVAVENIDIGGPTMIRAAAKNHEGVAVVVKPESYDAVCAELEESGGEVSASTSHWLANEAFAQTARYDAAISRWFSTSYEDFPEHLTVSYEKELDLAYGENPHQRAALYSENGLRSHILSGVAKLHGKALSFNNVLDLDSARQLNEDFEPPACTIVKHNNPCGVAIGDDALDAYRKALACDPLSAYGSVIAVNRPVSVALAEALHENFVEVLLAPGFEDGALEVLQQKEAIRILCDEERRQARSRRTRRQARARRPADPGPRRRPRAAPDHGGGDEDRARRRAVGRPALRLDGRAPRALERDRDRQGRGDAGNRRRPDEPRRLGPARGREVPRRPRRGGGRPAGRLRRRLRRLLPLRRRPPGRDRRRRQLRDPARRLQARRRGDRGLRRRQHPNGLHQAPAFPALARPHDRSLRLGGLSYRRRLSRTRPMRSKWLSRVRTVVPFGGAAWRRSRCRWWGWRSCLAKLGDDLRAVTAGRGIDRQLLHDWARRGRRPLGLIG